MSSRPRLIDNAASNLGRTMPPRLSIDANRFTLVDSTGNEKPINSLTLDIVICDLNPVTSKLYWGKPYDGQSESKDIPVCWSDNGKAPSKDAATPQFGNCLMCPHNQVGSDHSKFSGAAIKKCVDMKKIAFVVPGDHDNTVFLHTIKPGSFKNWGAYIRGLTQRYGGQKDLPDIVTRLSFESQGVVQFEQTPRQDGGPALVADFPTVAAQLEAAWARGVSASITGQDDVPIAGQIAQGQPAQQLAPPPQPLHNPMQTQTPQDPRIGEIHPHGATTPAQPAAEPPKRRGRKPGTNATGPVPAQSPQASMQNFQFPQSTPQPAPPPAYAPPQQQATVAPASTVQAAGLNQDEIPPFLRREQPPAAPAANPSFGFASPQTPGDELQAAINQAFSLPTK